MLFVVIYWKILLHCTIIPLTYGWAWNFLFVTNTGANTITRDVTQTNKDDDEGKQGESSSTKV